MTHNLLCSGNHIVMKPITINVRIIHYFTRLDNYIFSHFKTVHEFHMHYSIRFISVLFIASIVSCQQHDMPTFSAVTVGVERITPESAFLNGRILTTLENSTVQAGFQYSSSPNLQSNIKTTQASQIDSQHNYKADVSGLEPATDYYYRAFIRYEGNEYFGEILSFKTEDRLNNTQAIDLGLSVKWANCNIGANSPEENGYHYAWGEIKPKSNYTWATYYYCDNGENDNDLKFTKYNSDEKYGIVDNLQTLEPEDDVAYVFLGDNWRIPTQKEWLELKQKCTWVWTSSNGVNGRKVIGPNGNSLFLPATGFRLDIIHSYEGFSGSYWSSTRAENAPKIAYTFGIAEDHFDSYSADRYFGLCIRPVTQ